MLRTRISVRLSTSSIQQNPAAFLPVVYFHLLSRTVTVFYLSLEDRPEPKLTHLVALILRTSPRVPVLLKSRSSGSSRIRVPLCYWQQNGDYRKVVYIVYKIAS